jgi:hypothetical protein
MVVAMFVVMFVGGLVGFFLVESNCNPDVMPQCAPKYYRVVDALPVANFTAVEYARRCGHWNEAPVVDSYCGGYDMVPYFHPVVEFEFMVAGAPLRCNVSVQPQLVSWTPNSTHVRVLRRGDGGCVLAPSAGELRRGEAGVVVGVLAGACVLITICWGMGAGCVCCDNRMERQGHWEDYVGEYFCWSEIGLGAGIILVIAGGVLFSRGCDSDLKKCVEARSRLVPEAVPVAGVVDVLAKEPVCRYWQNTRGTWVCNGTVDVPTKTAYAVQYQMPTAACRVDVDSQGVMENLLRAGPTPVWVTSQTTCALEPTWMDVYDARVGLVLLVAGVGVTLFACYVQVRALSVWSYRYRLELPD